MKKILSLLLMFMMVFALTACGGGEGEVAGGGDAPDGSEEMMTYVAVCEPTFPPFEMTDADGNITGFDIDLLNAIAEDQGFKVEFQQMGFDAIVPAVQSETADIGASGITIRDDRLEMVNFSDPYINAGLAIAVPMDNTTINSEEDLDGLVAAVQLGTTGNFKADELLAAGVLSEVKTFASVDLVMMDLINGGSDVVINDLPVTQAYITAQPDNIKMVGEPLTSESYGFALSKENTELLEKINAGLKNVMENGTYDELIAKYF